MYQAKDEDELSIWKDINKLVDSCQIECSCPHHKYQNYLNLSRKVNFLSNQLREKAGSKIDQEMERQAKEYKFLMDLNIPEQKKTNYLINFIPQNEEIIFNSYPIFKRSSRKENSTATKDLTEISDKKPKTKFLDDDVYSEGSTESSNLDASKLDLLDRPEFSVTPTKLKSSVSLEATELSNMGNYIDSDSKKNNISLNKLQFSQMKNSGNLSILDSSSTKGEFSTPKKLVSSIEIAETNLPSQKKLQFDQETGLNAQLQNNTFKMGVIRRCFNFCFRVLFLVFLLLTGAWLGKYFNYYSYFVTPLNIIPT